MEPGDLEILDTRTRDILAFRRISGKDRVTVAINLRGKVAAVTLDGHRHGLRPWGWMVRPDTTPGS